MKLKCRKNNHINIQLPYLTIAYLFKILNYKERLSNQINAH